MLLSHNYPMSNNIKVNDYRHGEILNNRKSIVSAILIGIGLAGLIDITIFHQILQWHHTTSNKIVPNTLESLQMNIVWDGVFLSFSLIITIIGIGLLWYASGSKNKNSLFSSKWSFIGFIFIGFGGFNIIEGIINHHILGMHHVIDVANPFVFDLTFLVVGGLAFLVTGGILIRSQKVKHNP
jgi:uncharacterized membrane protein